MSQQAEQLFKVLPKTNWINNQQRNRCNSRLLTFHPVQKAITRVKEFLNLCILGERPIL